jgi:hypothetical protein
VIKSTTIRKHHSRFVVLYGVQNNVVSGLLKFACTD